MVWSMGGSWRIIHKERFFRCQCLLILHPINGLIGHIGEEVIVRVLWQLNRMCSIVDIWSPLVGLPAKESIKLIETLTSGPAVKGPRNRGFPCGCLMPFSKGCSTIAVQTQHLCHRGDILGNATGVTRKSRSRFDDSTHIIYMVVAPAF